MNWQRKARIQNLIAALPASNAIYYAVQRTLGSLRPGRTNPLEWFQAGARLADWIEGAGRAVEGASFLEVGTGRQVNMPLALWLCGAGRVATVDLNTYLSGALVAESVEYVRRNREEVARQFGARGESRGFRQRLSALASFKGDLGGLLRLARIEYLSPADAARLPFAAGAFDFHVSYAVFEHIPEDDLRRILAEARRVLKPAGLLVHVIDPSDHFSHDDPTITAINFLQFGGREWERLAGNRFMFHNRLRARQYLDLFERAGVRVLRQTEALDEASLSALREGFPVSEEFRSFTQEELAVRSLNVMGTFAEERAADGAARRAAAGGAKEQAATGAVVS
ncbi:MAG TPA: methyltransferase domain-containing protein [Pyrinomonadaceae bacterium]|nr:methyltransferase domain-containing protein [Pyrinomonadaceae bacterium]